MSDQNPIIEWYNTDEKVKEAIDRLSASGLTIEEQAAAAFDEFCEAFSLPKYPGDFTDEMYARYEEMGIDEPRSVFEEFCIIRYLKPKDDLRGVVMLALYHVHEGLQMPMELCARKYFRKKKDIPREYMLCYMGDGINGRVHFLKENESWTQLGARIAIKVVSNI